MDVQDDGRVIYVNFPRRGADALMRVHAECEALYRDALVGLTRVTVFMDGEVISLRHILTELDGDPAGAA